MSTPFRYLIHFGMHFVQIYFIMSSWILANFLFPLYFDKKKVGIGTFVRAVFVRYFRSVIKTNYFCTFQVSNITCWSTLFWFNIFLHFRLFGPLALLVLFGKTTFYKIFERGPQATYIHVNYDSCKNNGWATLFLVNSHFKIMNQVS